MKKCVTKFTAFRYNSFKRYPNETITWYVLQPGNDADDFARCFTETELNEFLDFVVNRPINFPDSKQSHICEEGEGPYCGGITGLVPRNAIKSKLTEPRNLVLRKQPQLNNRGDIFTCMDVILLDHTASDNHTYNLDFDVIGRIEPY